jgi:hypothetical protein
VWTIPSKSFGPGRAELLNIVFVAGVMVLGHVIQGGGAVDSEADVLCWCAR